MHFRSILLSLLGFLTLVYAIPKTVLEGENGIIVEDDGSTKIDGETGITTNASGQTTNVGGPNGITITPDPNAPAQQPKAAANSTGSDGLAALLSAAGGTATEKSEKGNSTGTEGASGANTTGGTSLPPGVQSNSTLGGIFSALEGAR